MKTACILLVICPTNLQPGLAQPGPVPDAPIRQALLDSLTQALGKYYVYPDKAAAMSRHLLLQHRNKQYDSVGNAADLANLLNRDLHAVYNDKHLVIRYDPDLQKRILAFNATQRPNPADQTREQQENFFFKKVEILPSNIGYLAFTNFADTSTAARQTVRAALQFLAHTDALIIDLRNNYGGNGAMAAEIASYFFATRTFAGRSYNRLTDRWTDQWIQNDPTITQGLVMDMPVYLLTSKRTFSAAEGLAYNLQQLKKATVVGDTSRGGAHLTRSFSLGNGYVGFIPFTRYENAHTHTDWEGTGIVPNVYERESNSLPRAQQLILHQQLTTTTNTNEQNKIRWQLNYLRAQQPAGTSTQTDLTPLAGSFEEFTFALRDQQLVCINTHNGNKTDQLVLIEPHLFQVNQEMQVAFVANDKGVFHTVKLYWSDGWVDTIRRTAP